MYPETYKSDKSKRDEMQSKIISRNAHLLQMQKNYVDIKMWYT